MHPVYFDLSPLPFVEQTTYVRFKQYRTARRAMLSAFGGKNAFAPQRAQHEYEVAKKSLQFHHAFLTEGLEGDALDKANQILVEGADTMMSHEPLLEQIVRPLIDLKKGVKPHDVETPSSFREAFKRNCERVTRGARAASAEVSHQLQAA